MRARAEILWRLFAGHRRALTLGVVLNVGQALTLLPIGLLVQEIFSDRIPAGDTSGIVLLGAGILALYAVSVGLSLWSRRIVLAATHASVRAMRERVLARLHELPLAWHASHPAGELHARVVPEAERVEALSTPMVTLGQVVIVAPPMLVLAVIISPVLALIALVVVPLLIVAGVLTNRRVRVRVRAWVQVASRHSATTQVTLRTMPLVRGRGADPVEEEKGRALIADLEETAVARTWLQNVHGIVQGAVAAIAGSLILTAGSVLVAEGDLELADLLAFYAILGLLLRTVSGGSGAAGVLTAGLESLRRLESIADDPTPSPYTGTRTEPVTGDVALRGVTFGYGDAAILTDFDLSLSPGEHVALVGPNGAGKSTVAGLLLGLHRPWSGTAQSGGVPLEELDVGALRRQVGYLPQEPMLRPSTLAENIAFGRPDADRDEVARVAALAGVGDFLHTLGEGLDTELGDEGVRLSGGERQRVALARALVGGPLLLILDEPTNHLDAAATARFTAMLDALDPAPAILLITHDEHIAAWADRCLTLGLADGAAMS